MKYLVKRGERYRRREQNREDFFDIIYSGILYNPPRDFIFTAEKNIPSQDLFEVDWFYSTDQPEPTWAQWYFEKIEDEQNN